jgi:hypothetical protein
MGIKIMPMLANEKLEVPFSRLVSLEEKSRELERAKKLIRRLRAENAVLKDWKREALAICEDFCAEKSQLSEKRLAVKLIKVRLTKI